MVPTVDFVPDDAFDGDRPALASAGGRPSLATAIFIAFVGVVAIVVAVAVAVLMAIAIVLALLLSPNTDQP